MSRRNTEAWNMIHSMCRLKELDEKRLYERSKRLLTIYRKVCWVTADRADRIAEELVYYCGSQLDDALVYLEEFAPDEDREKFEDRVRSLFQTRWMVEMMPVPIVHLAKRQDKTSQARTLITSYPALDYVTDLKSDMQFTRGLLCCEK